MATGNFEKRGTYHHLFLDLENIVSSLQHVFGGSATTILLEQINDKNKFDELIQLLLCNRCQRLGIRMFAEDR